jgi:hypothetical protein
MLLAATEMVCWSGSEKKAISHEAHEGTKSGVSARMECLGLL